MDPMSITLTCKCGQQQFVAPEFAGQSVACLTCGQPIAVPAMGVPAKSKPKPPAPATSMMWIVPVLVIAGLGIVMVASAGALAWALSQRQPEIAQNKEPDEKPQPAPVPNDRTHEETKKPDATHQIEPAKPKPKEKPKEVIQPVKVKEPPKPIIEPIKPKPIEKQPDLIEPLKLVWRLREGEVFFQEVTVTQKPTFKVQGLPVAMLVQYAVYSRFTVKKQHEDGSLVVEQKIENTKFMKADDLSKQAIVASLLQLGGTVYTIELSPKMDVTKFEGGAKDPQFKGLDLGGGGFGMQMSSLIDRDGWKELAQATFFQLDQTPKAKMRWSKPMTHNWGGLGSWQGQIHYQYIGQEKDLHRIVYGLQLAYKAPNGGGLGMMKVNNANFQPQQAEGQLLFDSARGKVVSAEERFRVRGVLNANLLGQNTLVEIDEDQHFLIRIHDKMP